MVKFHNSYNKFLWKKGILPFFIWVLLGFLSYLIIILFNESVVSFRNIFLILIWGIITLGVIFYWYRNGVKLIDFIYTYTFGFTGETSVKKEMKSLNNNNYYYIFHGARILGLRGDIDF